jgi:hypothetical protein
MHNSAQQPSTAKLSITDAAVPRHSVFKTQENYKGKHIPAIAGIRTASEQNCVWYCVFAAA